jgi:hypothetical protein
VFVCLFSLAFFDLYYKMVFFFKTFGSLFVRKNLLHCETGFGVYRSTQLGHILFFLLLPCEQQVLIELAINSGDFW